MTDTFSAGSDRVATTHGSNQIDPTGDEPARRPRTAAEQRADRASGSNDPEVLADEIERTREDLAETLDAIADKVSPKRVSERTKKKVTDSVKEKTDAAKEHLQAGAASAKETAKQTAEHAKEQVQAGAASAKQTAEHAKEQVQEKVSGSDDSVAATPGALADRADTEVVVDTAVVVEPVGADVPPAAPLGTPPPPAVGGIGGVQTYGASPAVPKEAIAGAAAALAVVLLLLRRRKDKRARGWKPGAKH